MTDGLVEIDGTGMPQAANLVATKHSVYTAGRRASRFRVAVGWLPTAVILTAGACLLPYLAGKHEPAVHPVALALAKAPATVGLAKAASSGPTAFDPSLTETIVPEQPAPVDGLKISSQSWRRGGLGSNALVTMTLRNNNEYTVKDIGVACAFTRPDGSHLTDRTRLLPGVINMKSRKTFVRRHVGFVNVNAAKAKCSVLAANHI